jgi:hypothetical protein
MIYFVFNTYAQAKYNLPCVLAHNVDTIDHIDIRQRFYAESIFEFVNGTTVYYKDRLGRKYNYTEDEIIMFKLKNG